MHDAKTGLRSPVPWMGLALVAAAGVILWLTFGKSGAPDVARWSKGGDLQETEAFLTAINHPAVDKDQWQSGAGVSGQTGVNPDLSDYAFPHISIYSVPNIHPPQAHPTLRDLGDKAQARAIDAIEKAKGSKSNPWDDLKTALSAEDEPGGKDPFLFDRVLVATVAKGVKWPPGDRMVWTRAFVTPVNFKFAAYTIASTENETVKVSSVEAVDKHGISTDIKLAIPGVDGSSLGMKPDSEKTVKTNFDVNTQYERLGVDIMPSFLRIIRESGAGGDVTGNTKVALSITTDPEMIMIGSKADKQPDPKIDLVVSALNLGDDVKEPTMDVLPLVPLPHCALRAKISAVYEQRHIQEGRNYYDESRQNVVFIHDVDKERTVEIMGADDVSPFVWAIQLVPDKAYPDDKWKDRRALSAKYAQSAGDHGSWRQLIFSDYGRAVNLAHWVRTHVHKQASGYEFNWDGQGGLAVIKHVTDDCLQVPAMPQAEPD